MLLRNNQNERGKKVKFTVNWKFVSAVTALYSAFLVLVVFLGLAESSSYSRVSSNVFTWPVATLYKKFNMNLNKQNKDEKLSC